MDRLLTHAPRAMLRVRLAGALLCAGLATLAAAQQAPGMPPRLEQDPADRLLKEQFERQRDERLRQETPEIAVPKKAQAAVAAEVDPESVADAEPTFRIEQIVFGGNTVLREDALERIAARFRGKRLGVNRINLLLKRVTEAFIAKGYITTRAYLGEQNLASGTLTIRVVPGRIEAFRLNGKTLRTLPSGQADSGGPFGGGWLTDQGTLMAFPLAVGETLKLADLEQGLDQLNRLRRNQAELQILPGETPGGSVVAVNERVGHRWRMTVGGDNYGAKASGTVRTRLGLDLDNAIGLQEAVSFGFVGSKDTNALFASASLPWGYNSFSYAASYSESHTLIGDSALLFSTTRAQVFGANRVVERSREAKSSIDATLTLRRAEREINNLLLTPQRLSVLRFGANRLMRFGGEDAAGTWSVDLGVSRGLHATGASRDAEALDYTTAHSQFTKVDAAASLTLAQGGWLYRGALAGQWSRVGLFASEQFFAGGAGSVRGFRDGTIAGDRGWTLRNELAWAKVPEISFWGTATLLQPYAFVDAGATQLLAQGQWNQIAGAGAGLRLNFRAGMHDVLGELILGVPLTQPHELGAKDPIAQASFNWTF